MKVLIYGDSNVWGDNFNTNKRLEDNKQWVNILKNKLPDYTLYQQGMPGRLAGNLDLKAYKNGQDSFPAIFRTIAPIDVVIIALGSNDLQLKYNRTLEDITTDLLWYKEELKRIFADERDREKFFKNKFPKIYYILPINFDYENEVKNIFNFSKEEIRIKLRETMCNENLIILENASLSDGIHLSEEGHMQMANKVYEVLSK